jgi:hypothetical protein
VLLYYPLEHKADASQIGLVRMSSFILQEFSAEKGFAASLNRPFEGHGALPSNVRLSNFHGTYADFMIMVRIDESMLMTVYLQSDCHKQRKFNFTVSHLFTNVGKCFSPSQRTFNDDLIETHFTLQLHGLALIPSRQRI